MRVSVITFFLACLFLQSRAQLTVAKIFGDHMVLQRDQPIPVWGWASPKGKVTVSLNNQLVKVKADDKGNWKAILPPMTAGGPYEMKIVSGKEQLVYDDVMLGEVWICSG